MKNYYSTIDEVVTTFSDVENRNGFDEITVRFERVNDKGEFDFAEGKLPENVFYKSFGFSEDEMMSMEEYMRNNAFIIWQLAMNKGEINA